jgi:hypothetical protein
MKRFAVALATMACFTACAAPQDPCAGQIGDDFGGLCNTSPDVSVCSVVWVPGSAVCDDANGPCLTYHYSLEEDPEEDCWAAYPVGKVDGILGCFLCHPLMDVPTETMYKCSGLIECSDKAGTQDQWNANNAILPTTSPEEAELTIIDTCQAAFGQGWYCTGDLFCEELQP